MPITLVGNEGWFNREGAFIGAYNRVASLYGSEIVSDFQAIWSQFATSDQGAVVGLPSATDAFRQTGQSYQASLGAGGAAASILQANRNFPLVPYTFGQSVIEVRDQMIDTSQSINRPTLDSTITDGASNLGNTEFFVSTINNFGDPLDMTVEETLTVLCTSQGSGFGASFSINGEPTVTPNSWNWPQGSGASTSVTAFDPATGGLLTNGDFEDFTVPNLPDGWTIANGAAGVTVFEASGGGVRAATNAVYFLSDGASATQLIQVVSLAINTVYAITFQAKMNVNSAAGNLIVRLTDASGTTLQNDAGADLEYTLNLNGGAGEVTTSYQIFTAFFSTPRQLPSTVQIRIGYEVAATSTRELTIDLLGLVAPTPLYGASGTGTAGPYVIAVSNTNPSAVNDGYTIAFTNSLSTDSFVWGLQRLFNFRELGLYLPSNGSPTISDDLVTY